MAPPNDQGRVLRERSAVQPDGQGQSQLPGSQWPFCPASSAGVSGFIAVTSLGAMENPCQWTGMGCWSSSRAMWWKPTFIQTIGCVRVWPLTHLSTDLPAAAGQLPGLSLANCSHLLYSVKYTSCLVKLRPGYRVVGPGTISYDRGCQSLFLPAALTTRHQR